ncbi:MAG TPA: hypothetical protein VEJ22_03050 [Nitrospirota bacterium]|nr:hypothetical protein [Nitrospirota bacterium]
MSGASPTTMRRRPAAAIKELDSVSAYTSLAAVPHQGRISPAQNQLSFVMPDESDLKGACHKKLLPELSPVGGDVVVSAFPFVPPG